MVLSLWLRSFDSFHTILACLKKVKDLGNNICLPLKNPTDMEMLIKAQENVSIWAPGCVYTAAASLLYSKNHQLSNFCRITNSLSVDATTRTPSSVGGFCLDRLKSLIYQIPRVHPMVLYLWLHNFNMFEKDK